MLIIILENAVGREKDMYQQWASWCAWGIFKSRINLIGDERI